MPYRGNWVYDAEMKARIYQPSKTAMQSGQSNTRHWVIEYEPEEARKTDSLMGWTGSGDMRGQIQLQFATKGEAIAYAERNEIPFILKESKVRRVRPKSYSDNFRYDKFWITRYLAVLGPVAQLDRASDF